ncbi:MAG TPA: hypothetical protein DDW51_14280 [Cyanobacteria bacterium UBA11367]|nr:hypothetical protein [Cyanobacteria bacterium UBA11367]
MPLSGGATDKFGNRYEGRWTVFFMVDVMDENADAIRLEPPGEEGEGVEFWISKGDSREYHQVKRQYSGGNWTLANLERKQVLSNFWKKLKIARANCTFVSSDRAFQLDELADRARRATSWQEFHQEFLKANQSKPSEQLKNFNELCIHWHNCPEINAYEALKRVHVKTISEDLLRSIVESRIETLVEGNPANIADVLAQYALDKVHYPLTGYDIWNHLEERGFRRRNWAKDRHVLAAVQDANNRYISPLREAAIANQIILRDEVQIVLQKLTNTDRKKGVLIIGEAGVGKSGVMLQVFESLQEQGLPVLAFRIDRLESTLLPNNIDQQLGLPGSPANVLAAIAQKKDCVLIIDQLDAISLASGRNPQFFDCIFEIIKQAQSHPQMRLVLACRKFDLDNDYRLRRLTDENGIAEPVTIHRLPHEIVQKVVTELGLDATQLNSKQLDLLSVPLHLRLLSEVAKDSSIDLLNFKTVRDLYDHFWQRKQEIIERVRLCRQIQWNSVIDALCDYMSRRQILSASQDAIENWLDDGKVMVSEHVLVKDGKRYSFFHEGFFDYAFARRFAARGCELLSFLGTKEQQHLFRRAQVRQILLHEREADFEQYLDDLQSLLTRSNIRFHIKQVVFALLAAMDDPTAEEWQIIAPLIEDKSKPITQQVWGTLRSSIRWFQLLDSLGIIEKWLRDESGGYVEQAVMLLLSVQKQIPDRVVELVKPFIGVSEAWRNRLVYLVSWADLDVGDRFFALFLQLIDEGILDEKGNSIDFWDGIYSLLKKSPELTCEIIGHYLNRRFKLTNKLNNNSGIILNINLDHRIVLDSANKAPLSFVTQVLPYILRVIELTARQEGKPPWIDRIWGFRKYGLGYDSKIILLSAIEAALSNLSANHPEDFASIAEELCKSKFETIQYLLIRAYTTNGKRFADEAIDYLCEQPARLKTGYSFCSGNGNAAPYWATKELLEVTTPHCSEERLVKLETLILDYYPEELKSIIDLKYRGYPQLILLYAIDSSRRTEIGNRRLQEWRRKFTDSYPLKPPKKIATPTSSEDSRVKSPIPENAADKMTDEQWLKAIARYDYNDGGTRFQLTGQIIGGAAQLSMVLEQQVKKHPARFAKLIQKFTHNINSSYFDAILRGIAEVGLDLETAFQVCQYCHQLPHKPCGRSISDLFNKLAELPWSQEALDILIWYALVDPDPDLELWRTKTSSGEIYYNGDILMAGINSTRGSAVSAIAKLIFADINRAAYFLNSIEQIVKDSSTAVRSCAVEALIDLLNYDRDLAVSLFQQLCETEEVLLGTQTVEYFLYYAIPTHFQQLASILERMIISENPEVVGVGARQACLASLDIQEAHWLAEICLSGTEDHRLAAAEIFIANLTRANCREFCETALVQLFHDSSEKVRSEAAKCFLNFEGGQLGEYISLVDKFIDSPALYNGDDNLIRALEKTTAKLPDAVTYRVCECFFKDLQCRDPNLHNFRELTAEKVSKLLVKLYDQTKNQQLKSDCLNLIDIMAEMEVYKLTQVLNEYER